MRLLPRFLVLSLLLLAAVARATVGLGLQTQLGNPSSATTNPAAPNNYLLERPQYSLSYNNSLLEANWVSWNFTPSDRGSTGRTDAFAADPLLPSGFNIVNQSSYSGSGFDRGHMCPSADRTLTVADNEATFFMTNMIPQAPDNNQGPWAVFENETRAIAATGFEMLIISGPGGFGGSTIASGVAIPGFTWKVALAVPAGSGSALSRITASTRVIAIKMPNVNGIRSNSWTQYVTSIAQIEADTGLNLLRDLEAVSPAVAAALRPVVDGQTSAGAPVVTGQPAAQSAPVGGSATFSVTATGDGVLSYQWFKDGNELPAATAATLVVSPVQAADAGAYSVLVSNLVGATSSNAVNLTVTGLPPVITGSPVSQTVGAGSTVTFSVAATGSPTLAYVWRRAGNPLANGGKIAGATTATLTLTNVQADDIAAYDVVVSNSVSSAPSAPASLTVTPTAPTIVTHPVSLNIAPGGTAVFTVAARGTEPFAYLWRKGGVALTDGGNIAGSATSSLTVSALTTGDVGNYDVVVSNGVSSTPSNSAALALDTVTAGRISYLGGTYNQDFNALPLSGTTTITGTAPLDLSPVSATLNGWQIALSSTASPTLIAGTGSSNTGGIYAFGSTGSTERALGTLASGSTARRVGAVLVNNTGLTITQFTVAYTGEQWRNGGNTAAHTLAFGYALGGVGIRDADASFSPVADLNFVSPIATATAGALDGNSAANRSARTATVTGVSWTPGQTLVLRWNDVDDSGSDHGFGIDDFSFSTSVATLPTRPFVASTTPAAGATNVALGAPVTIVFDQPVTVGTNWFSLSSSSAGALSATVTASPDFRTYTLSPPVPFGSNDTVSVTVFAAAVTERGSGTLQPLADTSFSFTTETIAAPVAPTVTTQPIAQTVVAGSPVSFTVAASGTAPLTYAWAKDGTPIAGNASAATPTLTLGSASLADIGSYTCLVTNVAGSDVSQPAALNVTLVPPTITTQPLAQTVLPGSNVSFTVAASGTAPFSYVWRKGATVLSDAGNISGSGTATLTLTGVTLADSGDYSVIVSNGANSAPSNAATLSVTASLPSSIYWNFTTATPTSGVPSGVTGGTVTQGNNNGTTTLLTSVSVSTGTGTYPGASGTFNAGAAARIGALNQGANGSAFFTFSFTPPAGRQFTVSRITFGSRSTGTGPQAYSVFSSVDNFTTAIATGTFLNNSAWAFHDRSVSVAGATDATVTFRIYGHNGAGSPGTNTANWRIDDLTVTATVVEPAAVAPQITTPPLPQIATVGDTVVFSAAASGTPAPTFVWRRNLIEVGTGPTLTLPSVTVAAAGIYDVVVSNSAGSVTSTGVGLTVNPAPATVALADLGQAYSGTPRPVTVTTSPAGLAVSVTYNGDPTPPTYPGTYAVVATITDPNRTGSASGSLSLTTTALVRRAPTINAGLDGSIQVVNAENISLPGTAWIAGDLLVQGSPTVNVNAAAIYGSTLDAAGSPTPTNFSVTLNAGTTLAHVVRRINPVTLPVVTAPPAPTATRNVSLNAAGQSPGDFATLRNLTLSSNAGLVAVPPGTYGVFNATGNTGFILGVAGSTTPAVYNLQGLSINALPGNAQIQVVGPVIINLPSSAIVSGRAGSAANPEWLTFRHATNGFSSTGNVTVHASVIAPNGLVNLGGSVRLRGTVISDRLTLGGTTVLEDPRP